MVTDQKLLPIGVLPIWFRFGNEMVVEEDEAEVVAATVHLPGVIGVLHEGLQVLLANCDCRENIA